jgi:antirestriction protein ArdC
MSKNFKPLHEQIAEKLITQLQEGTSAFQKPWNDSDAPAFNIPVNPTTNKNYRGMNSLWLTMQGHEDPRWMTLKQASCAGYSVKKGAKATLINFFKSFDIKAVRNDITGEKIQDENGKTKTSTIELDRPVITNAWVFNANQIKGITPLSEFLKEKQDNETWKPIERAETLLAESKADIRHGGNEAYYSKADDHIQLPQKKQFDNETQYYAVALHEVGHWTGNAGRLNRQMEGGFGSEPYAREELRAEIASLMLGSEMKIGHNFGQHAAYVNSWLKILKDDPFELFRASADAQKIFDYMINIEQKRGLKHESSPNMALAKGEEIAYNNNVYRVLDHKGKILKMEDMDGSKFNLKPSDNLYRSLVSARNNPVQQRPIAEQQEVQTQKIGR